MALKNQALTIAYTAWNASSNEPQTGDAANHTLKLLQDGAEGAPTNEPLEVDSTDMPGSYKLALTAGDMDFNCIVLGGKSSTSGVFLIPITIVTERGVLPTASPAAAGGFVTFGAGTGQLNPSGGAVTVGTNSDKTGYTLSQSFPANFASMALSSGGAVTVGTNSDKTGYTLSQSFPANFASMALSSGGAVTVGTNSDKTGYTLSQSFPANFASMALSSGGAVTVGTNSDKTGYTIQQNFPLNFGSLSISSEGVVAANVTQWWAQDVPTPRVNGVAIVDVGYGDGIPWTVETAQGGTSNTITLQAGESSVDGFYAGMVLSIISGTGSGQDGVITGYVGATCVATVQDPWLVVPDNTSVYVFGGTRKAFFPQTVPTSNAAGTVGDCLNAARAQGFGAWALVGTTLSLYAADGVTVVRSFTLDSSTSPSSRT